MTRSESLIFLPQPEEDRLPIMVRIQDLEDSSMHIPHLLELGHILTPDVLATITPEEYKERRLLRMGAVDSQRIMNERKVLAELMQSQGLPTFTITSKDSAWRSQIGSHTITMEGNGQTENYPRLTDQQLWFRFRDIHGNMVSLESTKHQCTDHIDHRLIHPDLIIPHTFTIATEEGGETVSLLTNNTDSGFAIFSDLDGQPHLFVNQIVFDIAEATGQSESMTLFLEQCKNHVKGIHCIQPVHPEYTPLSALELDTAIIMQNITPETRRQIANLTGKEILTCPTLVANQEAGYGGPRCVIGTTDRKRAVEMYDLAQRELPRDYKRGQRSIHEKIRDDILELLKIGK